MTAYSLGQKAEASVRLLVGMRLPAVQELLEPHGFNQAVLDDGLERLRELVLSRSVPGVRVTEKSVGRLVTLEHFCQLWFPIARSVLKNMYPQAGEKLFEGLRQAEGVEAVTVTAVFLDRLSAMEAGDPAYGKDGVLAVGALAVRGLKTPIRQAARTLVDSYVDREPASPRIQESFEREERALESLWNWYLEWSAIARKVVKRRNQRQALGLVVRASPLALLLETAPVERLGEVALRWGPTVG